MANDERREYYVVFWPDPKRRIISRLLRWLRKISRREL
jgi:hypothetical protein